MPLYSIKTTYLKSISMELSNTRDCLLQKALSLNGNHYILELATGTGKSKIAVDKIRQLENKDSFQTILVVVPRNVLKNTWKEEFKKWWPDCVLPIIYTTYASLHKWKNRWDFVIFDECHHLSDRCKDIIKEFKIGHALFLSATISKGMKAYLYDRFPKLNVLKADLREVIDDGILPDPKVYLMPLRLDGTSYSCIIRKNPKASGEPLKIYWKDKWDYAKVKNVPIHIYCTEQQYIQDLNNQIDWWKRKYMSTGNEGVKNKWLKLCGDRLVWLSNRKAGTVKRILEHLKDFRTLTFCSSIEQTEALGEYCINSKNDEALRHLDDFNKGKINHITACNMLNEGCNLYDCQVGIYANINSSDIIVKQRAGRLLRHKNPVIVIPYYRGSREEELVGKMLENYNPELVKTVNFAEEIDI